MAAKTKDEPKQIEVSKIIIKVGNQEIALTLDEAKKLKEELKKLFSAPAIEVDNDALKVLRDLMKPAIPYLPPLNPFSSYPQPYWEAPVCGTTITIGGGTLSDL